MRQRGVEVHTNIGAMSGRGGGGSALLGSSGGGLLGRHD
jgi:hypothetical protein